MTHRHDWLLFCWSLLMGGILSHKHFQKSEVKIFMAQITFPNQDQVTIHKERYDGNFLQVSIDEWTTAFSTLKPGTFGLYLYLCGNMDGFNLALSSVAVQRALGYSDSTYRRAKKELIEKGYLIVSERSPRKMDFFPTPPIVESSEMTATAAPVTSDSHASAPPQQEEYLPRFPSSQYVTVSEYDWVD